MMTSPKYSAFHPKPLGVSKASKQALARGLRLMYMSGLDFGSPDNREEGNPSWWNANLENVYRCQVAGYRDEKHYLEKRRLKDVEKWSNSGLIKKLIRWDGMYYYFGEERECPKLKSPDVKKSLLHETVIFENSPYTDGSLQWAPVLSKMTKKINEAYEEVISNRSHQYERTFVKKKSNTFCNENLKPKRKKSQRKIKRSSKFSSKCKPLNLTKGQASCKADSQILPLQKSSSLMKVDHSLNFGRNKTSQRSTSVKTSSGRLGSSTGRMKVDQKTKRFVESKPKVKTKKTYSDATLTASRQNLVSEVHSSVVMNTISVDRKSAHLEGDSFSEGKNLKLLPGVRDEKSCKEIGISKDLKKPNIYRPQKYSPLTKKSLWNLVNVELKSENTHEPEYCIENSHKDKMNYTGVLHKPPMGKTDKYKTQNSDVNAKYLQEIAPLSKFFTDKSRSSVFESEILKYSENKSNLTVSRLGDHSRTNLPTFSTNIAAGKESEMQSKINPGSLLNAGMFKISEKSLQQRDRQNQSHQKFGIPLAFLTTHSSTDLPRFDVEAYSLHGAHVPINTDWRSAECNVQASGLVLSEQDTVDNKATSYSTETNAPVTGDLLISAMLHKTYKFEESWSDKPREKVGTLDTENYEEYKELSKSSSHATRSTSKSYIKPKFQDQTNASEEMCKDFSNANDLIPKSTVSNINVLPKCDVLKSYNAFPSYKTTSNSRRKVSEVENQLGIPTRSTDNEKTFSVRSTIDGCRKFNKVSRKDKRRVVGLEGEYQPQDRKVTNIKVSPKSVSSDILFNKHKVETKCDIPAQNSLINVDTVRKSGRVRNNDVSKGAT